MKKMAISRPRKEGVAETSLALTLDFSLKD
jgi:hypothetical protein